MHFVIKNLITPLLEHVGLVVRSGGLIHATAQAQSLVARLQQQFTLVCFAPKDPILFGAVYDLAMQSRHTTVVTTTIDAKTLTALDALSKLRPEAQVEVYTCNVVGLTEDTATTLDRVSVTKIQGWHVPTIVLADNSCVISSSPLTWDAVEKSYGYVIMWRAVLGEIYDELQLLVNRLR